MKTKNAQKMGMFMIKINREWAMPNSQTFKIKPIANLLKRYIPKGGIGWIDPMAGYNSPALVTNDIDPKAPTAYHMDAEAFLKSFAGNLFAGIIFDPPYSYRQISENYKALNLVVTRLHTSANFKARIKNAGAPLIKIEGIAINCGWNSNGFGISRGFEIIEILIIAHGGDHNDTIVTVERKIK